MSKIVKEKKRKGFVSLRSQICKFVVANLHVFFFFFCYRSCGWTNACLILCYPFVCLFVSLVIKDFIAGPFFVAENMFG